MSYIDIVDLTGFIYNLQSVVTHGKNKKTLRISKKVVKDQTGCMEIVLFSSVIDKVSNNTCYDFKKKWECRNSRACVFKSQRKAELYQKMKVSRYL